MSRKNSGDEPRYKRPAHQEELPPIAPRADDLPPRHNGWTNSLKCPRCHRISCRCTGWQGPGAQPR